VAQESLVGCYTVSAVRREHLRVSKIGFIGIRCLSVNFSGGLSRRNHDELSVQLRTKAESINQSASGNRRNKRGRVVLSQFNSSARKPTAGRSKLSSTNIVGTVQVWNGVLKDVSSNRASGSNL
jgi:hypothetical protein